MKNLVFVFCLFISITSVAQTPGVTIGNSNNDNALSFDIMNDSSLVLVGTSYDDINNGMDFLIVKFNQSLNMLWQRYYGYKHNDVPRKIICIDTGYLIAGTIWDGGGIREDIALVAFSNDGNMLWEELYAGTHRDQGFDVEPLDDGYAVLGYSKSDEPSGDIMLVRTNKNGEELWRNNYGTPFVDYGFDIMHNDSGLFIAATAKGFFNPVESDFHSHDADMMLLKIDDNGNEIYRRYYGEDKHDLLKRIVPYDNGFLLFGSSQSYSHDNTFDAYLMKTNMQGDSLWSKSYGYNDWDYGESLCINNEEDIYILMSSALPQKEYKSAMNLYKLNNDGEILWNLVIEGEKSDYGVEVKATSDGGCYILGTTKSYGSGGSDFFLAKISKEGIIETYTDTIEEYDNNKIVLKPNPANNYTVVDINSSNDSKISIQLFDIYGKLVYQRSSYGTQINISQLKPGTYIVKAISNRKQYSGKLIIY